MDVKFALTLPRAPYTVGVARCFLRAALEACGICGEFRDDTLSALSEACANAIDHGFPAQTYRVELRIREDLCILDITDFGSSFDPQAVRTPEADAESGRGIFLMRHLMDSVALDSPPGGGTRVQLCKWRQPLNAALRAPVPVPQ